LERVIFQSIYNAKAGFLTNLLENIFILGIKKIGFIGIKKPL